MWVRSVAEGKVYKQYFLRCIQIIPFITPRIARLLQSKRTAIATGRGQASWTPILWLTVSPMVERRGGTVWTDHARTVGDGGYMVVHLGLSGALPRDAEWFVDLRNLAVEDYVSITLVRANVNGGDSASYFPGELLSVFGGLRWSY